MSLDISITLSDSDLKQFAEARNRRAEEAKNKADTLDAAAIVGSARSLLEEIRSKSLPDFVKSRLKHLETVIAMVEDVGFGLPEPDRDNALAALAYFSSPDDLVPDDVPVLGFLDDAIVIELCARELQHEIEAYCDFRNWRDNEATRRGESKAGLMLNRVEWAEARRIETIERMHRRRNESYTGGTWSPVLFKVG